jgi:prepilin-type N-terminal cleavage/methylation domain-containing protein
VKNKGLTLIELMMVVLILSVMASVALPLGKIQFVRYKEDRLQRYLDDFRYGIDEFYKHNTTSVAISGDGIDNDGDGLIDEEINDGKDNDGDGLVDEDLAPTGYPRSLYSMIQNHWLRRVPAEPFGNHWQYRPSTGGPSNWKDFVDYGGSYEAQAGDDIYDIRTDGSRVNTAIDGSQYSSW